MEERVNEEVKLIESKVKAFLRTKLDELKESAIRELESEYKMVRAYKVFEAVKTIVAAEIDSDDVYSAVKAYEKENMDLQNELRAAHDQLEESMKSVNLLESKLDKQESELSLLSEALEDEKEKAEIPFKSSE